MEERSQNSNPQVTPPSRPRAVRLPGFIPPPSQGFFSRMRDFLTERPVKVPKGTGPAAFNRYNYSGGGFLSNLKDYLVSPRVSGNVKSRMIVERRPML